MVAASLEQALNAMAEGVPPSPFDLLNFRQSGGSFVGRACSVDTAVSWLGQFDEEDREAALTIIGGITYMDVNAVNTFCRIGLVSLLMEYEQDPRRLLFIPVERASKSGSLLAYFFRTANKLSAEQFVGSIDEVDLDRRLGRVLVFLDDYVGSGNQFSSWWAAGPYPEFLKLGGKQHFMALIGTTSGKRNIHERTGIPVTLVQERWDGRDWSDSQQRLFLKYGAGLYAASGKDHALGYEDTLAGVAFFYNVPNNTPPVVWSTGTNSRGQAWFPLLQRHERWRGSRLEAIKLGIAQILESRTFDYEEMLSICEHVAQLGPAADDAEAEPELFATCATVICEALYAMSGGDGIRVWPPAIAQVFVAVRDELINSLGKRTRAEHNPDIGPLIRLFSAQDATRFQNNFISRRVHAALVATIEARRDHLSTFAYDLTQALDQKVGYVIGQGVASVLSDLGRRDSTKRIVRATLKSAGMNTMFGKFLHTYLLVRLGLRGKRSLEPVLTEPYRQYVRFWINSYGKMVYFSLDQLGVRTPDDVMRIINL